jgi:hypothetical protein
MVQTKSKPRVRRQQLQVQRIFRVKLNAFQSRPDTPYFWLQLEGPRENMGKAKVNSFPPFHPDRSLPLYFRKQGAQESPNWILQCGLQVLAHPPASRSAHWLLPLLSFLPHPSLACHFCPSSALGEPPLCVSPQDFSGQASAFTTLFLHLGTILRPCISVTSTTHLFVLHQDFGRPTSFCLFKSWVTPLSARIGGGPQRHF